MSTDVELALNQDLDDFQKRTSSSQIRITQDQNNIAGKKKEEEHDEEACIYIKNV